MKRLLLVLVLAGCMPYENPTARMERLVRACTKICGQQRVKEVTDTTCECFRQGDF